MPLAENEKRTKGLGAKARLLADLKLRAERRLEAADEEIARLRDAIKAHRASVPTENVWTLEQIRAVEWQKNQHSGLIELQYEDLLWLVATVKKIRDCNELLWQAVNKEANK